MSGDFRSALEKAPNQTFQAVVRTVDSPAAHVAQVEASGVTVHRVYKLIPALAVSGQGRALLKLAEAPWVESIEIDKTVRAL